MSRSEFVRRAVQLATEQDLARRIRAEREQYEKADWSSAPTNDPAPEGH